MNESNVTAEEGGGSESRSCGSRAKIQMRKEKRQQKKFGAHNYSSWCSKHRHCINDHSIMYARLVVLQYSMNIAGPLNLLDTWWYCIM